MSEWVLINHIQEETGRSWTEISKRIRLADIRPIETGIGQIFRRSDLRYHRILHAADSFGRAGKAAA